MVDEMKSAKAPGKSPATILVVDDESTMREMLKTMFEQDGYHCLTAESGHEALKILEAVKTDVVVTDINMPGMSGIELVDKLKSKMPEIKVVFMSGYSYKAVFGGEAPDPEIQFIQKPLSPKDLALRVRKIMAMDHD